MSSCIEKFKPAVPKRYLMLVAALVWLFAGGMLMYKGLSIMIYVDFAVLKLSISITLGIVFFFLLFSKIVKKHIARIIGLKSKSPCFFSFFSWKSYLLMGFMISMGILLRRSNLLPTEYLAAFYVTMATPLLISSFHFFANKSSYE